MKKRTAVLTLLALLVAPTAAEAAQRYASPTGSGSACTQANPCTLDTAVEDPSVVDGDEVIVTPGTYSTADVLVTDAITLHGQAGQPRPTINVSSGSGLNVTDSATVRDLKIQGASVGFFAAYGSAGSTFERLDVSTSGSDAFACMVADAVTIRDSVCWASGAGVTWGVGGNVTASPAGTYAIKLRNVTAVAAARGIFFNITAPGVTFDIDAKNVIADGGTFDVWAASFGASASTVITLANSNYATQAETPSGGSNATVTDPGTGTNQTAAPTFVNAGTGDFHQTSSSPTIDAGVTDAFTGTMDLDGDARSTEGNGVCPTAPDIGADEFVGAPVDCDPPETTIAGGPTGTTSDSTPTFDLQSDEAGSTFECRVDGAAFAPCTTPFTTAPLADGAHTLEARATDPSGNTDPTPDSRAFTVDTSVPADTDPPETTLTTKPKPKVKTKKKSAKVTFAFSSDESGRFECKLDKASFSPCTSPLTLKAKKGKHTFSVRAVDAAGNTDASPATASFKVKRKKKR